MDDLKKLKKYLEEELRDCLELKRKKDLTEEGRGMLTTLRTIFQHMGWEIKED